ncbi:hypothetical protein PR048_011280 [Dryococelus australis]|uniref:Uncharacterized protein n=1 Tax=Dryococelus australis TaxID=614101 RepID=A0ABQ9HLP7_9NEOP|nr:hypothetical protein PR048_011280 [Dryococelus australis]
MAREYMMVLVAPLKGSQQKPVFKTTYQTISWQRAVQVGKDEYTCNIFFSYLTNDEHLQEEKILGKLFHEAVVVTGTLEVHASLLVSAEEVEIRMDSAP